MSKKKILITVLLLGIICLPLFFGYTKLPQFARSLKENNFSLFSDIGILNGINKMRGEDIQASSYFLGKLFYNKSFWLIKFVNNILEHFVPRFYFASGDQDPIHGFSNFGPLFLVLIFPAVNGVLYLIKNNKKITTFLFFWLFSASLPSALMSKSPDQLKFFYCIPAVLITISYGIVYLPKRMFLILVPFFLLNAVYFYNDAVYKEPFRYSQKWSLEFDQVLNVVENNYSRFDHIFITNKYFSDPVPLFLFSSKYPPSKYLSQQLPLSFSYRLWLDKVDKIKTGELDQTKLNNKEKNLFIIVPQEERVLELSARGCYKIVRTIKNNLDKEILLFAESSINNCKFSSEE